MRYPLVKFSLLLLLQFVFSFIVTAQFIQQGPKLVGTGNIGNSVQGAVAISGDGNTAIVGGRGDNGGIGAVWVYIRSGAMWEQQGGKLVGNDIVGAGHFGLRVSLSFDGNTAIIGGAQDNNGTGAAWIFTRSGGVWAQQGPKLVGTGAVLVGNQGFSVSISADGNTVIESGVNDNMGIGATWVFTRSGGVWAQQGNKLVGTGGVGTSFQGSAIALSGDGNTVVIGGINDNTAIGAVWIFTRSGGTWAQQGEKLVGTGAAGTASQGWSVSISYDGNTAASGGIGDNINIGAVWVFTRSAGIWSQQGEKLLGAGAGNHPRLGMSVSVSSDGNTIIGGGPADNNVGAAWAFTRSGNVWLQRGNKFTGTGAVGNAEQGFSVSVSSDGNTAIMGGIVDSDSVGAAWVFINVFPTIQSFTPTSACINATTQVEIKGTGFTGATSVSFGGTPAASFTVVDDETIMAVVGNGSSGDVTVITGGGTATLSGFTFYTTLPTVGINASPSTLLCQGSAVTLTGTGAGNYTWTGGITNGVSFIPVATDSIFSSRTDFETANRNCNLIECKSAPERVAAGDIDGDGKKDLVVTDYGADSIFIFRNTSSPGRLDNTAFAHRVGFRCGRQPWPATILPYDVAIDDIDGDGKNDIVVTNSYDTTVSVFRNISSPGVLDANSLAPRVELTAGITPLGIEIADIDGDGKKDLIVANLSNMSGNPSDAHFYISIFRNISTLGSISAASFAPRVDFETNHSPKQVAVADIDGDGKQDILVIHDWILVANALSIFKNTSTAGIIDASSLQPHIDFATGLQPTAIAVGDLDGDNKKDIAITSADNILSLFRNESLAGIINETSLSQRTDLPAGNFPWHLSIADMNGDAKNDIIVTNAGGNTFSYFRNTATGGTFNNASFVRSDFNTGENPRGTAIDDFDSDGRNDLALANNADSTISIFGNQGLLYTVTGTNANGCSSNASVSLTVIPCNTTPLTFINISASRMATNVKVNWRVSDERGIKQYIIERSLNGIDFSTAGTVAAKGNNGLEVSYSFIDEMPAATNIFYRIKSVGNDGEIKYSAIAKLNDEATKVGFSVAPNPVQGNMINLQFNNQPAGKYGVRVVNYIGQVMVSKTLIHFGGYALHTIALPQTMAGGMYSVEIIAGNTMRYRLSVKK